MLNFEGLNNGLPTYAPNSKYTNIENGTIKGVGNVTNLQTWT